MATADEGSAARTENECVKCGRGLGTRSWAWLCDDCEEAASDTLCECCEKPGEDIQLVYDEDDANFTAEICRSCREALGRGVIYET